MKSIPDTNVVAAEGLRERHKTRRRRQVVQAAADLWREHGFEAVSLRQIADAAEVAPQTIYSLIGGMDSILMAVVETLLERLDLRVAVRPPESGIDRAMACVRISVDLFVEDGVLFRQVLVRTPRAFFDGAHAVRDSARPRMATSNSSTCGRVKFLQARTGGFSSFLL